MLCWRRPERPALYALFWEGNNFVSGEESESKHHNGSYLGGGGAVLGVSTHWPCTIQTSRTSYMESLLAIIWRGCWWSPPRRTRTEIAVWAKMPDLNGGLFEQLLILKIKACDKMLCCPSWQVAKVGEIKNEIRICRVCVIAILLLCKWRTSRRNK